MFRNVDLIGFYRQIFCLLYRKWANQISSLSVKGVGKSTKLPIGARDDTRSVSLPRGNQDALRCFSKLCPKPVRSRDCLIVLCSSFNERMVSNSDQTDLPLLQAVSVTALPLYS